MVGPKVSLNWSDLCSMCSSRKVINFLITFPQITFAYREKRSIVFEGKLLRRKIEKWGEWGSEYRTFELRNHLNNIHPSAPIWIVFTI